MEHTKFSRMYVTEWDRKKQSNISMIRMAIGCRSMACNCLVALPVMSSTQLLATLHRLSN